jgi:hypothetical protein
MVYAQINRQTKAKAAGDQVEIAKFVKWAKKYIADNFERVDMPTPSVDLLETLYDHVNSRDLTTEQKRAQVSDLNNLLLRNKTVTTKTKAFIKKEIVFGDTQPRLVAARESALRNISSIPYEQVAKQVYKSKHMIKGLSAD